MQEYKASNQKTDRREDKRFVVEKTTLAFVALVAILGIIQTRLTSRSLKSTEAFATLDERPYIYLSKGTTPQSGVVNLSNGPAFVGMVSLSNFGKSPAVHVFEAGEVLVLDNIYLDEQVDLDKQTDDWFKKIGIPLAKTRNEKTGYFMLNNGIGIMESTIMQDVGSTFDAYQGKGISIGIQPHLPAVIVGRIEYSDTIGNLYWTDICWRMAPQQPNNTAIYPCSSHNEIH